MSEVILVVLWRPEAAAGLLQAAGRLAEIAGGARINALAVQVPLGLTAFIADGSVPESVLARIAAEERDRVARLKAVFDGWTAGAGDTPRLAEWFSPEEHPDLPVEDMGRRADFIVVARPVADDDWPARRSFHTALFRTERPILVVPPDPPSGFGRRIAIAWRDDRRAVKAVLPALRCLTYAERVHLLSGVHQGAAPPGLPGILLEHGITAEPHLLPIGPGPFGESLLAEAHRLGCDMLVMGAYAHSELREMILGGVTRFMLTHADLPVLMRH